MRLSWGLAQLSKAGLESAVLLVSQNELFSGVGEVGGATGYSSQGWKKWVHGDWMQVCSAGFHRRRTAKMIAIQGL